jgi:hypothetical protein
VGPARRGSLRGCESSADVLARRTPGHCKRGHTRSVVTRELSGSKAAPPPLPRGLARLDVRPRGPRFAWNSIAREMLVPRPRSRSNDGAQRALSFTFASRRAGVCGSAPSTRMRHERPIRRRKTRASLRRGKQSLARPGSAVAGEQAGVSPSGRLAASDHDACVLADEAGPRHADGDRHARA